MGPREATGDHGRPRETMGGHGSLQFRFKFALSDAPDFQPTSHMLKTAQEPLTAYAVWGKMVQKAGPTKHVPKEAVWGKSRFVITPLALRKC